jgi:hypothetical protein
MSTPAASLNMSPARCGGVPVPEDAKLIWPGRPLASATRSFTVRTGSDGCTTMRLVSDAIRVTGAKSLIGSYGSFGLRFGLMPCVVLVPMKIV